MTIHKIPEANPATFIFQKMKLAPPQKDQRLPRTPAPSPCEYGCPLASDCKKARQCCRTFRMYVTSETKQFSKWNWYLGTELRPLSTLSEGL